MSKVEKSRLKIKESEIHYQSFQHKKDIQCSNCGKKHTESGVQYCEECGFPLEKVRCPSCGTFAEKNTDVCETCFGHLAKGECSFCGEKTEIGDAFCGECGGPLNGVLCPVCRTHNQYNFCMKCNTPLTEMAVYETNMALQEPLVIRMNQLADEVARLKNTMNANRNKAAGKLTVSSLYKRKGDQAVEKGVEETHRGTRKDEELIKIKEKELQGILNDLEAKPLRTPILVRNYAMARKPGKILVGWRCNYKHAVHSNPQACAYPQKGGKWVVLNNGTSVNDLIDDEIDI